MTRSFKSLHVRRRVRMLTLSVMAMAAFALCLYPAIAGAAGTNSWNGRNLPGGAWTTGNGGVLPSEFLIGGGANTTSSVCVGPITHDAGGYHAPYGWHCGSERTEFYFPDIAAAAGLYNPNPGTFGTYFVNAFSH